MCSGGGVNGLNVGAELQNCRHQTHQHIPKSNPEVYQKIAPSYREILLSISMFCLGLLRCM